jgi:hypothetical protein
MAQPQQSNSLYNTLLLSFGLKGSTWTLTFIHTVFNISFILSFFFKAAIGLGNLGVFLAGIVAFIKFIDPTFRVHIFYRYWRGRMKRKKK